MSSSTPAGRRLRYAAVGWAGVAALVACQGLPLTVPTLKQPPAIRSVLVETKLDKLEMRGHQVCPLRDDGTLLVFSGKAKPSADGTQIDVNGVTLRAGDTFYSGPVTDIRVGFQCGTMHYPKAAHVETESVSLHQP